MKSVPHRCYPCSEVMVETADGTVRGFVGMLRFANDAQAPVCPECSVPMVPVRVLLPEVNDDLQVERDSDEAAVAA